MTLFGKDMDELEVVAADFLPDGKKLYIIVCDGDCNLHVLQYDPEGKCHVPVLRFKERDVYPLLRARSQILQRGSTLEPQHIPYGSFRLDRDALATDGRLF